jgi:hypothetical protein
MSTISSLQQIVGATVDPNRVGIPRVNANQANLDSALNGAFVLAGAICVLFVVVGGIRYVMSEGQPGKIEQAKNTVVYALVGLAVTAIAFMLVRLVIDLARG